MKRLRQSIYLVFCAALLLSGCRSDKKKEVKKTETEKITYRDSFTKEEKTNGTAEFDLMENMKVDAEITPLEKYKDGLKKYYMKQYFETKDLKDRKDFADKPVIYGKKLSKVLDMLSEYLDVEFETKNLEVDISSPYTLSTESILRNKKGNSCTVYFFWDTGDEEFDYTKQLYCPQMHFDIGTFDGAMDYDIVRYLKNYKNTEVSFLKDREKTGLELKAFLEKLLGRKLSDAWECIPVTEKSVDALKKAYEEVNLPANRVKPKQEYCTYRYYYDVKGFPFVDLNLMYPLKEGETYSKIAGMSTINKSQLYGLSECSLLCRISEDGVVSLETAKIRMEGGVYKEAEEVISPDAVLQKVKQYYERQILTSQVTVTDVSIVYTGYFTDGSEGEIQPTVAPFWRIRVYGGDVDGSKYFVYDAFTGEAVAEGVTATE